MHEISISEHSGQLIDLDTKNAPARVRSPEVRQLIDELPAHYGRVLRWLLGIDCPSLDPSEIAFRLNMTDDEVWRCVQRATEEIGWRIVTEVAA